MSVSCEKCPLRTRPAFKKLSDDELAFMTRFKMGELQVAARVTVMLEGSNSPHFHTALAGIGLKTKLLPDGRRQVVNFIFPGDLIGLQSSLLGEMKHGVESVTEMTLCVFARDRIWELFRAHPARAYDATWLAATEERSLGEAMLSVGRRGAKERVAATLLYLTRRGEESGFSRSAVEMRFPFRQQDLADAAGLSLVHTNKMIQELRAENLISLKDQKLKILKEEEMKALAMIDDEPDADGRPLL